MWAGMGRIMVIVGDFWRLSAIALLGLLSVSSVADTKPLPDHSIVKAKIRFLGRGTRTARTSFGLNDDVFLVEIRVKNQVTLAKLVYSALLHQPEFPSSYISYSEKRLVRVMRDQSCDSTVNDLTTRYRIGPGDQVTKTTDGLTPLVATLPEIDASTPLPCFRITPRDLPRRGY